MRESLRDAGGSLEDDYDNLLPLDKSELASGSSIPDIDSVIVRLAVATKLHPGSKWVDDAQLLTGKAYYIKKDYESALQTFQYISGAYKPKGKKEKVELSKKRPEYDGVKVPWPEPKGGEGFHWAGTKPVREEAMLWLVKTHVKQKHYDEALTIFTLLEKDNTFDYSLRDELEAMQAQMLIDQKKYADAVKPLIYAIALTDDKRTKTRYQFVLGQVYQLLGKHDKAIKAFEDVVDGKSDYKMEFFANINLAKSYAISGKSGGGDVIAMLQKLGRDEKYAEFHDRVWYTIAEIHNAQGNKDVATEYYIKSAQASVANKRQKGMAYLRLAEMNYNDQLYPLSATYYDSTVAFIGEDYDGFADLQRRSTILNNLVQQTNIITAQDSLQKLAGMTDKDRDRVISAALARYEKQQQDQQNTSPGTPVAPVEQKPTETAGAFYFYNPAIKASGYSEFVAKYGSRKNEDNWRRANKKSDNTAIDNPDANGPDGEVVSGGNVTYESLLAGVPTTPEKMEASNKRLATAYYKLATIYKDDFNNSNRALQTYQQLQNRFPGNEYEPQAWYQMYLIHNAKNETAEATDYRNRILQTYPDNPLAQYLRNPNYLDQQQDKTEPAEGYYNYAFQLYENGQYQNAMQAADSSHVKYPNNLYAPKFDLLKAFAIGQTQPKDSFKLALTKFTTRYTTGPEQERAKELLAMLNQPVALPIQQPKKPEEMASTGDFVYRPSSPHFLVVMFDFIEPTNKAIQDSILLINTKNYASDNLKTNTMLLDEKRQMIVVKQFKSATTAWNYYNALVERENLFDNVETTYRMFVIDDKNFTSFFKSKNVEQYMAFFEKHYK